MVISLFVYLHIYIPIASLKNLYERKQVVKWEATLVGTSYFIFIHYYYFKVCAKHTYNHVNFQADYSSEFVRLTPTCNND